MARRIGGTRRPRSADAKIFVFLALEGAHADARLSEPEYVWDPRRLTDARRWVRRPLPGSADLNLDEDVDNLTLTTYRGLDLEFMQTPVKFDPDPDPSVPAGPGEVLRVRRGERAVVTLPGGGVNWALSLGGRNILVVYISHGPGVPDTEYRLIEVRGEEWIDRGPLRMP